MNTPDSRSPSPSGPVDVLPAEQSGPGAPIIPDDSSSSKEVPAVVAAPPAVAVPTKMSMLKRWFTRKVKGHPIFVVVSLVATTVGVTLKVATWRFEAERDRHQSELRLKDEIIRMKDDQIDRITAQLKAASFKKSDNADGVSFDSREPIKGSLTELLRARDSAKGDFQWMDNISRDSVGKAFTNWVIQVQQIDDSGPEPVMKGVGSYRTGLDATDSPGVSTERRAETKIFVTLDERLRETARKLRFGVQEVIITGWIKQIDHPEGLQLHARYLSEAK